MKSYGASRATTASPDRVWRLWSDTNNWNRWNTGIRNAQIDGPMANGVTGTMTTNRGSTHAVTFSNVVPLRGFSMSMSGPPGATITFTCEITPSGAGSTIAQSASFSGPLAFLWGPLMGSQMAPHFVPVLDDLAAAAESTGAAAAGGAESS
jgi:hypothetical protein